MQMWRNCGKISSIYSGNMKCYSNSGREFDNLLRSVVSHSVVSDSLRPHGLEPARLLCPWGFPGKNTGVGSHFLLWKGDLPDPFVMKLYINYNTIQ